jgi:hypothetical protein
MGSKSFAAPNMNGYTPIMAGHFHLVSHSCSQLLWWAATFLMLYWMKNFPPGAAIVIKRLFRREYMSVERGRGALRVMYVYIHGTNGDVHGCYCCLNSAGAKIRSLCRTIGDLGSGLHHRTDRDVCRYVQYINISRETPPPISGCAVTRPACPDLFPRRQPRPALTAIWTPPLVCLH